MTKTQVIVSIISLAAFIFIGIVFLSSDFNRAAFGSRGHIDEGGKFGINIGASTEEVSILLKKHGLEEYELDKLVSINPQTCHSREYTENLTVQLFKDGSWRRGNICIISELDRVVSLSWDYGMFQP